ncbi:unnamed protein product [marine sediment metagenome]|uniref:Uncharacterized protein n=1 Tax=marine sediment metagenome TaxID=412755 RepID=X1PSH7_9ZZZZ
MSDDSLISSKVWGDAADLTTELTYKEVEFDSPQVINEEVRISGEFSGGSTTHQVNVGRKIGDVKPNEFFSVYQTPTWTDYESYDCAYRYTFYDWTYGGGGIDWENSTKGLLHVRHPALLSGEHRRDGKLLKEWTNLSNLDDEYLTGQVGVDVFSGEELKFATIAGVEYAFRVP